MGYDKLLSPQWAETGFQRPTAYLIGRGQSLLTIQDCSGSPSWHIRRGGGGVGERPTSGKGPAPPRRLFAYDMLDYQMLVDRQEVSCRPLKALGLFFLSTFTFYLVITDSAFILNSYFLPGQFL